MSIHPFNLNNPFGLSTDQPNNVIILFFLGDVLAEKESRWALVELPVSMDYSYWPDGRVFLPNNINYVGFYYVCIGLGYRYALNRISGYKTSWSTNE